MKVLLLALVLSISANASMRVQVDQQFERLRSPFLQPIPTATEDSSDYPIFAQFLKWKQLKWSPHPSSLRLDGECEQTPTVGSWDSYLAKCGKQVTSIWNNIATNTYFTMMIDVDPNNYARGRFVELRLKDGVRLKGFLALKGDAKPRPLVILRLGIFSNSTEFLPERFLFSQLFESTPFNVLVLESTSGSDFVERNDKVILGGFEEGLQNFEIAKQLQSANEPLSKLIANIHMAGMSLGGHGTLMAAVLNDLNSMSKRVINSFLLFCPLVNLQDTIDFHQTSGWTAKTINYWAKFRLHGIEKVVPEEQPGNYLHNVFSYLEKQPLRLPKEFKWPVAWTGLKESTFWKFNAFDAFLEQAKSPINVMATVKDPIVPYAFNASRLQKIWQGRSEQFVTSLSESVHCSLPGAYHWNFTAGYMQNWILKYSGLSFDQHVREFQLRGKVLNTWNWKVDFEGVPGASTLKVKFIEYPRNWRRFFRSEVQEFSIALTELDLPSVGESIDVDDRKIWQRWASLQIQPQVIGDKLFLRWKNLK